MKDPLRISRRRSQEVAAQRRRVQASERAMISSSSSTGSVIGSIAAGDAGASEMHSFSRRRFHAAIVFESI
jgi:hypothetical protein